MSTWRTFAFGFGLGLFILGQAEIYLTDSAHYVTAMSGITTGWLLISCAILWPQGLRLRFPLYRKVKP